MNYLVSDFILRVKNGYMARRRDVSMPFSNINQAIAKVLVKEGYLSDVKITEVEGKKTIFVTLRYENRRPVLHDVEVISKPSLRVYAGSDKMAKTLRKGSALAIISTSQGIMTGRDAQKKGVGGEVLFTLW